MKNSKKTKYNIITGVSGQIITICIGVLLPRLFIINYGSETNGFLSSINSLISYLTLLEAGVGTATVQALYGPVARESHNKINEILAATNRFYNRTGAIYAAIIALLAFTYPLIVPSDLSYVLQAAIIIMVGTGGVLGYLFQAKYKLLLQAEGKQYVITNIMTAIHVCTSITKLLCLSIGLGIVYIQAFQLLFVIVQIICFYIYIYKNYKWLDLKVEPDEKAISQKNSVLVHQISEMVFNHTDVVILTLIVGDLKVVSVYTLYNMLVDMISTLIANINTGFEFRLGQLYNTDKKRHEKVFDIYETYYMAFAFALYTVTYIYLLPFVKLYTSGVTDTNYLLPLLPLLFVSYKLLVCGRSACGKLSSYAGHFKQTRIHSIIETIINLIVSIVAVIILENKNGLGIYGVLIGTIAALLFRSNIMVVYANKKILFRSCWKTYKKWALDIVLALVCCIVFKTVLPKMNDYYHLIAYAAGTSVLVLATFFSINALFNIESTKYFFYHLRIVHKRSA